MILFESRAAIERQGIRQFVDGMRNEFPILVAQWQTQLERTEDWRNLGQLIARTLANIQPHVSTPPRFPDSPTQPLLAFAEPKSPTADESIMEDLKRRLQIAEAASRRESERATKAENEAVSLRWQMDKNAQSANAKIVQLTQEIADLQRIVGEQQYRLNQPSEKTTE